MKIPFNSLKSKGRISYLYSSDEKGNVTHRFHCCPVFKIERDVLESYVTALTHLCNIINPRVIPFTNDNGDIQSFIIEAEQQPDDLQLYHKLCRVGKIRYVNGFVLIQLEQQQNHDGYCIIYDLVNRKTLIVNNIRQAQHIIENSSLSEK